MSKSLGNVVAPQDVIKQSGADILRLWVCAVRLCRRPAHRPGDPQDHRRDLSQAAQHAALDARHAARISTTSDASRSAEMPELERLMLHRLAELDAQVRQAYARLRLQAHRRRAQHLLTVDLSAFYFDIRKDALYCDPISSPRARPRSPCSTICSAAPSTWLAPMLCFTAEEAWLVALRRRSGLASTCRLFPEVPAAWRDDALAEKWRKVRSVRRVVTGALETRARAQAHRLVARSRTRSSTSPTSICSTRCVDVDLAEICITSACDAGRGRGAGRTPSGSTDVPGVAVVPARRGHASARAPGRSCRASAPIRHYPDVSPRDAQALREWDAHAEIGGLKPSTLFAIRSVSTAGS